MDRKRFIKNTILGMTGVSITSKTLASNSKNKRTSTYDKLMDQVGFNHLPNLENRTMKTVLHKANTRGNANHGWLQSSHTFSFANYRNPERMHFGVLRVLNDDQVAPGRGFGTHPHDNMEIISIPLDGDLEHKDSMGNTTVIKNGDVQVMSAGTGVYHSEYNKNQDKAVKFLQIWMFPKKRNVEPRYDQITLKQDQLKNNLHQILSPNVDDDGVWVHQDAWFHLGELEANKTISYSLKNKTNGVYAFVLEGEVAIEGQRLERRDGFGIWDVDSFEINASSDSKILLMEVPMEIK
jgi:redox-sensitive bicupin YhaK (pirin superfamily)